MGVMLDDVVRHLHPEHAQPGHRVKIEGPGQPVAPISMARQRVIGPEVTRWWCSCGAVGELAGDDIGRALRAGCPTT